MERVYHLYLSLVDPLAVEPGYQCNKGFDGVSGQLEELKRHGKIVRLFDASQMDKETLSSSYVKAAVVPSVYGKYRIRTVFGSNRQPGTKFGISVPALHVCDPSQETPGDVYPHEKNGRYVTINEFLSGLLDALNKGESKGEEASTKTNRKSRKSK